MIKVTHQLCEYQQARYDTIIQRKGIHIFGEMLRIILLKSITILDASSLPKNEKKKERERKRIDHVK